MTIITSLLPMYRDYLQHERQLAEATVWAYCADLRLLDRFLDKRLEAITRDDLKAYLRHLSQSGKSVATIRRVFGGMSTFWRWAHGEGYIAQRPDREIDLPRRKHRAPAWMSAQELHTFIEAARAADDALAWLTLAYTGMRPDELRKLKIEDVRLQDGVIIARNTKSRADRVIPLHDSLHPLFARHIEGRAAAEYVFGGVKMWKRKKMYEAWYAFIERAGLPAYTPYALRHSFATHLALANAPIHVLGAFLGHKDLRTTSVYLHATAGDLRAALDKFLSEAAR